MQPPLVVSPFQFGAPPTRGATGTLVPAEHATTWPWAEIVAAALIVTGSALTLASDVFGAHHRWAKIGGVALTVSAAIPAWALLQEARRARAARGA